MNRTIADHHASDGMDKSRKLLKFTDTFKYFTQIKTFKELKYANRPAYFRSKTSSIQADDSYSTRFSANNNLVLPLYSKC